MTDYDTSIPLKSKWFELVRSGKKTVEVRRNCQGVHPGATVRFMKGYNPANGAVFRKIRAVSKVRPPEVSENDLARACLDRESLKDYANGGHVYLFYLEESAREAVGEIELENGSTVEVCEKCREERGGKDVR